MTQEYKNRGIVHKLTLDKSTGKNKLIVQSSDTTAAKLVKHTANVVFKGLRAGETALIFTKDVALNRVACKEFRVNVYKNNAGKTRAKLVRTDAMVDKSSVKLKRLDESLSRRIVMENGVSKPASVEKAQERVHSAARVAEKVHNASTVTHDIAITAPRKALNVLGDVRKRGVLHAAFRPRGRDEVKFKTSSWQKAVEKRREDSADKRVERKAARKEAINNTVKELGLSSKIDRLQPKTIVGKGVKAGAKVPFKVAEKITAATVNGVVEGSIQLVKNAPLAAESVVMTAKNKTAEVFTSKLQTSLKTTDTGNTIVTLKNTAREGVSLVKTVRQHNAAKAKYKKLKRKYKNTKIEHRNIKADFKATTGKKIKADVKSKKANVKAAKKNLISAKVKAKAQSAKLKGGKTTSVAKMSKGKTKAAKKAMKNSKGKAQVAKAKGNLSKAKFESKRAKKLGKIEKKQSVRTLKRQLSKPWRKQNKLQKRHCARRQAL